MADAETSRLTVKQNLFVGGQRGEKSIKCRVCGKGFSRWHGTANHGLMHVDRGEATAESDPYCPSTSGHRYLFYVRKPATRRKR